MIVMASYNSWNGVKLHGNHYLLTDILKGRMGFDGFVVGDWNAHEQVPGCTKSDCPAAILAGVDMLMAPDNWKDLYQNTLAEARSGLLPQARVDDAVRRILRVKAIGGLFAPTSPAQTSLGGRLVRLGSEAHRAIAREAVRKSMVLLKNARGTLPLDPHAAIGVAGDAADDIGTQSGGWTIDWQGDHNSNADFPGATSVYGGIRAAVMAAGGSVMLSRDGHFDNKPDVAIVVFGEGPYAEFEGDRETLEFSPGDRHELQLLQRLRRQGIPTVTVFLSGRPLWVNREINASDAFVAAWLPGSEGEGIADLLFRGTDGTAPYDFTGRLGFSWPRTAMPVRFEATGNVSGAQFARGWGLDYHSRSNVPRLSEEARISPQKRAPKGSLFYAGHVVAPWSLFVADAGAQVHVTTVQQESPHRAVAVAVGPDGAAASWTGNQLGTLVISGRASDLREEARRGVAINMRYRIEHAPEKIVKLSMDCAEAHCQAKPGASIDLTETFKSAPLGTWQNLSVPLSCLTTAGADLKDVEVPFALSSDGRFAVNIADVRLSSRTDTAANGATAVPCP
jgi:beta-glucosidase